MDDDDIDIEAREQFEEEFGYHDIMDMLDTKDAKGNYKNAVGIALPKRLKTEEYYKLLQSLNRGQQIYLKNFMRNLRLDQPIHTFISGASGCGKSRLIKAIYETMLKFRSDPKKDDDIVAIVGAYTAKAAINIEGSTIHSLLGIPLTKMTTLTEPVRKKLAKMFKHLELIIIDEISLIGLKFFIKICQRICQIKEDKRTGENPLKKIKFIVVGDLYQLTPPQDVPIFSANNSDPYWNLVGGPWGMFDFYELTEIMRQKEDKSFAELLRKMGKWGREFLSEEQVKMMNDRIFDFDDIPKDAVILSYTNQSVIDLNAKRLDGPETIINEAIDFAECIKWSEKEAERKIKACKELTIQQTKGMPHRIRFKIGCKYIISTNIDRNDKIVNGMVGILREIIEDTKPKDGDPSIVRVYLEFDDESVGMELRQKSKKLYKSDNISAENSKKWLPISFFEETIQLTHTKDKIIRKQFKLIEGEAMTIHKAQGQTFRQAAINMGENLTQALLYVACSRVTTINGLYLFGIKSFTTDAMQRMSEKQLLRLQKERMSKPNHIEMERLKDQCRMENHFFFLEKDYKNPKLSIMFHNVRSLKANRDNINSDIAMRKTTMCLFVECHTNLNANEHPEFDGFTNIFRSGSTRSPYPNGQACYIKNDSLEHFELITHNASDNFKYTETDIMEACLFKYTSKSKKNKIFICSVYRHPNMNKDKFFDELYEFIETNVPRDTLLFIMGDFNIDFNQKPKRLEFMNELLDMRPTLNETDTWYGKGKESSQLDWVFTNMDPTLYQTIDYESLFSDHSALYTEIYPRINND